MNTSTAFAFIACVALSGCATSAPSSGLVISNVTVISPERSGPLEHAYLRIVDGKIAELSKHPLRGVQNIDGAGRYLIPGLIDSHVHLALPPGFPPAMSAEQAAAHPGLVAAELEQDPKSFLFFGFTTLIDLVGTAERTARWNRYALRPDAHYCGAAAVINGQLREILYPYFSYGVPFEQRLAPVTDSSQQTPVAVVERIAAAGAICVKTIYEVGLTPTVAEIRALVAAAHARNLPVLIHANRMKAQAFAVDAGVDIIAHGMWRNPGEPVELDEDARRVLAAVIRDKIGYQPTTQVIAGFVDMHRADYFADPRLADAYPAALIEFYASKDGTAGVPDWIRNGNADMVTHARDTVTRANAVTRILADADARLLFGSDTPSDLIYTNPAGLNGRIEMSHWTDSGIPAPKLFRALTLDNARAFHLEDKIGSVETGKTANLLLLRDNPLQGVTAYDTIETVFIHGRPVSRAGLSARATSR